MTDYKVLISPRFVAHAKLFIQMIDKALNMLGPSDDLMTEILMDLGAKHAQYGVKAEYFPKMGRALVEAVGESLGADVFTSKVQESWIEVFNALSHTMIKGMGEVCTVEQKESAPSPARQANSAVWT